MSEEYIPPKIPAKVEALPPMNDDEVIAYTRSIRVKVVQQLMTAEAISGDNSDRILLTNMLNGLDSQAMGNKRIAADQKNADNTAVVVAELLRSINKNTIFTPIGVDTNTIDVSARVVPSSIPDVPAIPGEMDVAPNQLDYASFVRSQGRDIDELGKNVQHPESNDDDNMP